MRRRGKKCGATTPEDRLLIEQIGLPYCPRIHWYIFKLPFDELRLIESAYQQDGEF